MSHPVKPVVATVNSKKRNNPCPRRVPRHLIHTELRVEPHIEAAVMGKSRGITCKSRDNAHLMSIPPSSIFASSRKRPAVSELMESLKRTRGMPFIHLMKISRKIMAKKYGVTYGGSIRSSEREREKETCFM